MQTIRTIKIDPENAPNMFLAHHLRTDQELDEFWGQPYVLTNPRNGYPDNYQAFSLTGGAHDRPSLIATCDTVEEAVDAALSYGRQIHVDVEEVREARKHA